MSASHQSHPFPECLTLGVWLCPRLGMGAGGSRKEDCSSDLSPGSLKPCCVDLGILSLFKEVSMELVCHQARSAGPGLLDLGYWPCSAVPLRPNDYLRSSLRCLKGISHSAQPNLNPWSFSPNLFFSPLLPSHLSKWHHHSPHHSSQKPEFHLWSSPLLHSLHPITSKSKYKHFGQLHISQIHPLLNLSSHRSPNHHYFWSEVLPQPPK